ncbi:MAG: response regulator [Burkholderiales bacterium]
MQCATATPPVAAPVRVFFVEDSPLVRERLEGLVTLAGARAVGHASGAQQAIRAILAAHPDLVIVDFMLDEGSGFEVLQAIHDAAPDIELCMLSNSSSEPYRRIARRLGAGSFFDKSTEFERIGEVIAARAAARH